MEVQLVLRVTVHTPVFLKLTLHLTLYLKATLQLSLYLRVKLQIPTCLRQDCKYLLVLEFTYLLHQSTIHSLRCENIFIKHC